MKKVSTDAGWFARAASVRYPMEVPMRVARIAIAAVVLSSFSAAGCSSKDPPVVAGGTQFQMGGNACQNRDQHVLAVLDKNEQGQTVQRLLTDGADGARVRCQVDATHFSVAVSNANGAIIASGQIAGSTAPSASFTISLPTGTYKTTTKTCAVQITTNDGSNFMGNYTCDELDNQTLSGDECSIDVSSGSFFSFQNCSGF
jgi:hypothetical protein